MGLPIKHRKKYVSHKKRWDKQTIENEAVLTKDYALKNKNEIRKVEFQLSKIKDQAKIMNSNATLKSSEQAQAFIEKLKKQGFLSMEATTLDEVLDITLRSILERRLANVVYKNKLARTPNQARQFVVHGHVSIDGKVVNSPSYMVSLSLEPTVQFVGNSSLADENHPERNLEVQGMKDVEQEMEEIPVVTEHEGDSDAKEAALDDEEQDEVKN